VGKTGQESAQERRKWNWLGHTLRKNDDSITKQALQWTTRPQRKRATKEYLEKDLGNVDNRIQVQLEEDGGGSTRQSWMETSGLWPMFHRKRQGIKSSEVNKIR